MLAGQDGGTGATVHHQLFSELPFWHLPYLPFVFGKLRKRFFRLGGLCVGWWRQNQLQDQEGAEERRLGGWQRG